VLDIAIGTDTDLLLDLTADAETATRTEPAPAPEPFEYHYAFANEDYRPLESWAHLLRVLALVGQGRPHAYLFVSQVYGPRSAQCIGNALQGLLVVEVALADGDFQAVVHERADTAPEATLTAACGTDAIIRRNGRFSSLRSYLLTAPARYFLSTLDAGRAIQHWLANQGAPDGLLITPDNLL